MQFNEQDSVRVLSAISDTCAYTGRAVSLPAGQTGTVVVAGAGDAYDVEFTLTGPNGPYNAVLIISSEQLAPVQ